MTHKQRVLRLLSDNQPHSHLEGYRLGVMLHSRVAELRTKDGYTIKCWCEDGKYWYQLFGSVRETQGAGPAAPDGNPGPRGPHSTCGPPDQSPKTPEVAETGNAASPGHFSPPAGARQPTLWEAA